MVKPLIDRLKALTRIEKDQIEYSDTPRGIWEHESVDYRDQRFGLPFGLGGGRQKRSNPVGLPKTQGDSSLNKGSFNGSLKNRLMIGFILLAGTVSLGIFGMNALMAPSQDASDYLMSMTIDDEAGNVVRNPNYAGRYSAEMDTDTLLQKADSILGRKATQEEALVLLGADEKDLADQIQGVNNDPVKTDLDKELVAALPMMKHDPFAPVLGGNVSINGEIEERDVLDSVELTGVINGKTNKQTIAIFKVTDYASGNRHTVIKKVGESFPVEETSVKILSVNKKQASVMVDGERRTVMLRSFSSVASSGGGASNLSLPPVAPNTSVPRTPVSDEAQAVLTELNDPV